MARKDDRVKIRELPGADVSSSDMLAIGKDAATSGEKTTKATVGDVVYSSLDAGSNITITKTSRRGTQISAPGLASAADLNALANRVTGLESDSTNPVHVSSTPPTFSTNENGDLWWDCDNARMYVFYGAPGHQGVWVQTNPSNKSAESYDDTALKARLDALESGSSSGSIGPAAAGPNSITASATLNLLNAGSSSSGFGGSSGATIDANNGFSSITRPSRGKYVFTFSSPRATDTGYQVLATRFHNHPLEGSVVVSEMNKNGFTLLSVNDNSAITDPKGMYVVVVG